MKQTFKTIARWLDTWNEYPSHIYTVALIAIALGGLAVTFALLAK
jgi:hypothetical protein